MKFETDSLVAIQKIREGTNEETPYFNILGAICAMLCMDWI